MCVRPQYTFSVNFQIIFSRVLRDSTTRFVGPSVGLSVHHTLLFLFFCGIWPHSSCPNDQVTSNIAPAHPHAPWVAAYPALFFVMLHQRTWRHAPCGKTLPPQSPFSKPSFFLSLVSTNHPSRPPPEPPPEPLFFHVSLESRGNDKTILSYFLSVCLSVCLSVSFSAC